MGIPKNITITKNDNWFNIGAFSKVTNVYNSIHENNQDAEFIESHEATVSGSISGHILEPKKGLKYSELETTDNVFFRTTGMDIILAVSP